MHHIVEDQPAVKEIRQRQQQLARAEATYRRNVAEAKGKHQAAVREAVMAGSAPPAAPDIADPESVRAALAAEAHDVGFAEKQFLQGNARELLPLLAEREQELLEDLRERIGDDWGDLVDEVHELCGSAQQLIAVLHEVAMNDQNEKPWREWKPVTSSVGLPDLVAAAVAGGSFVQGG